MVERFRRISLVAAVLLPAGLVFACSGSTRSGAYVRADAGTDSGGPSFNPADFAEAGACSINNTSGDLDKDYDGDGFVMKDDCDECNTSVNRGAMDIPGNGMDDDCDGTIDNEVVGDDTGLSGTDPYMAARAIGIGKAADPNGKDWGIVEARWTKPDGTPLTNLDGAGILSQFGVNIPQSGKTMLALSSGRVVETNQETSYDKRYESGTPVGYPKESAACPGSASGEAHDGIGLMLKIRPPSNAKSFSYQQNFFTMEFPTYICSTYNDFFVTMMNPIPSGLPDGNIAFDQDKNPISVNNSLLQVCEPQQAGGKDFPCPLGPTLLEGTGFSERAATGWLTTTAPVKGGSEITLLFTIWDSGDGILDSTVLIDDFKFSVEGSDTAETKPSVPK